MQNYKNYGGSIWVDQTDIYLHEGGDQQGDTILFLHGSPLAVPLLAAQFRRSKRLPLPGTGSAGSRANRAYQRNGNDELTDLLANIFQAHSKDGTAHVIGLSYSGVVAQALISEKPNVVKQAFLSGTSAKLSRLMTAVFRVYLDRINPF